MVMLAVTRIADKEIQLFFTHKMEVVVAEKIGGASLKSGVAREANLSSHAGPFQLGTSGSEGRWTVAKRSAARVDNAPTLEPTENARAWPSCLFIFPTLSTATSPSPNPPPSYNRAPALPFPTVYRLST